jgi:hypothetical protein
MLAHRQRAGAAPGAERPTGSKESTDMRRFNTYRAYSIARFIVWAVILTGVALLGNDARRQVFLVLFLGETLGWFGATIARSVYPPPGSPAAPPRAQ